MRSAYGLGTLAILAALIAETAAAQDAPAPPRTPPAQATAVPAPTPITDLLTRMDALEAAIARLTAQNEEMGNRLHQLEERLSAPAAAAPPPPVPAPPPAASANASNLTAMTQGADHDEPAPAPQRPPAERIAAVKAVVKPHSNDPALDEYSYGFRLYTAKLYPEAVQQLKLYLAKYPHDAHVSHARNLLGRAYLDDGKPRDAAPWFLTNYKTDPKGARAADSLLNLAAAMRAMNDQSRACIALSEFSATYPDEAQGRLARDYARAQGGLTCN